MSSGESELFIERIEFDLESLVIRLTNGSESQSVTFSFPRAFRFFSESDRRLYIDTYNHAAPVIRFGKYGGVYTSLSVSYLMDYLENTPPERVDENSAAFLLLTGQECVEVIGFERPAWSGAISS